MSENNNETDKKEPSEQRAIRPPEPQPDRQKRRRPREASDPLTRTLMRGLMDRHSGGGSDGGEQP